MNTDAAAPPDGPSVAAIVVAADSGPVLLECLERLLASPLLQHVRLVDNASRDGVPEQAMSRFFADQRLRREQPGRNLGFGRAVNRAAGSLASDWLLVLNPDAVLDPEALDRLMRLAGQHDRAGLIGVSVMGPDGRVDPASHRRDPLLRRILAHYGLVRGPGIEVDTDTQARQGTLVEAEAISGALMLVRRQAFEQLGGFDEGYFLHFEDLDLCRRMRDAGWQVLLARDIRLRHARGTASRHRPVFVSWHKHCGMLRWFGRFDPAARNPFLRALVYSGVWLHFLLTLPADAWRGLRVRRRRGLSGSGAG